MERSFWKTIRGKLLSRTLLVVLLPVLVLGGVAVVALSSLNNTAESSVAAARETLGADVIGTRVSGVSEQISRELAVYIDERLSDVQGWSTAPTVVDAAKSAATSAEAQGLPELDIEAAEAQFADAPQLGNRAAETELFLAVENSPDFKEIFFTDVHGFNVAYSNQTSDFVQSDEGWWQSAMESGLDVSVPEFDASAGVFAVDVSVRIDDNGTPVGVMKAALDIQIVQTVANRFTTGADEFEVTVVTSNGQYLAETVTGHEAERIMSETVRALDSDNARVAQSISDNGPLLHPDGFSIDDEAVGGYSEVALELVRLGGASLEGAGEAFDWTVIVEQPTDVAFASLTPLEELQTSISDTSSGLTLLLVLVALAGVIAAVAMSLVFARRITRPIATLRDAAVKAAEVSLPNVVAQIDQMDPDDELPELEPLTLATGDEVEDLAHSFNTVQQTAANLASDQARMRRRNVATTFVNLGRRNQNLLSRQLEHINEMENTETNSDTLERLFELDHLATRMRRNAESLLVLAGEETPRRFRKPVSMHQLVQAAGAEIEDFGRIEIASLDEAFIEGSAASDAAHLLAELLENASHYSPPGAPIQVHGHNRDRGYTLSLIDRGIGMDEEDLETANSRLEDPAEFDRAPSAYLGHFVVGHLSRRHGIKVKIGDSPYGGVTAQIMLPPTLVVDGDQPGDDPAPQAVAPVPAPQAVAPVPAPQAVAPVPAPQAVAPAPAPQAAAPAPAPQAAAPAPAPQAAAPAPAPQAAAPAPAPQAAAPAPAPQAAAPVPAPGVNEETAPWIEEVFNRIEPPLQETTFDVPPTELISHRSPADLGAQAPAAPETTPSGFRRRRKGKEGAPALSVQSDQPKSSDPRDPAQVQASLQRFRSGVEQGQSAVENNPAVRNHQGGEGNDY